MLLLALSSEGVAVERLAKSGMSLASDPSLLDIASSAPCPVPESNRELMATLTEPIPSASASSMRARQTGAWALPAWAESSSGTVHNVPSVPGSASASARTSSDSFASHLLSLPLPTRKSVHGSVSSIAARCAVRESAPLV